ncbi:DUF3048 domain-containing protein [Patescibacteria group bacterium]|nr:DUF3048 domain-containing protein [Patescibacteria group bacterium]
MSDEITIDLSESKTTPHFLQVIQKKIRSLREMWRKLPLKQKILISAGSALLVLIIGFLIFWLGCPSGVFLTNVASVIQRGENLGDIALITPEGIRDQESPLDGVLITVQEMEQLNARRPLAVIVENHPAARPVYGLNQADIVYEALVEGGITRFMPIYLRNETDKIGPIRSLRTYFLDWLAGYNEPLIMHIGYAPPAPQSDFRADVLAYMRKHGDILSLGINNGTNFWRVQDKVSPHNAFSSTARLWQKAEENGWMGLKEIDKWSYQTDIPFDERPETQEIALNWNGWGQTSYSVKWVYNRENNYYLRECGGQKSIDSDTGEQIWAKNIVIEFSQQTLAGDSLNHILYQTTGNGDVYIFRDGQVISGSWHKNTRADRTKYYDGEGNEIKLNRGRSWIMMAPTGSEVNYE